MWLPILGLIIGVTIGLLTDIDVPEEYANYLSIAILAALDTLIGGYGRNCKTYMTKRFLYLVFSQI